MVDPEGGAVVFFFTKMKLTSKKIALNMYKTRLKMLEMAILETQIFIHLDIPY